MRIRVAYKTCISFIYKIVNANTLNVYCVAFSLVAISCYFLLDNAYAENFQVTIVNSTINHCNPLPSCYEPFQVDVSTGDTITWINQDNRTHTVTTGTSNYGPVGVFDSGSILSGHIFTQFFGVVGKYQYFDKTDGWPAGIIIVNK